MLHIVKYNIHMRVAELRKRRGLTQVQLAERIGVEQPTISRIERGDDGVSLRVLRHLAIALDVEVADLLVTDRAEAEDALISAFRQLSPERQAGWLDLARAIASRHDHAEAVSQAL